MESPHPSPGRSEGGLGEHHARIERISEPWYMNKVVAVVGTLVFAMVLGQLAATGNVEMLILVAVWVIAVFIIIFVRDHWWSPALIVSALSLKTFAAGFAMTGMEVGVAVIALTFPIKLAMKTLWPAKPKMDPGVLYWALLAFVVTHAVVILFYSKIDGVPALKYIIKAYYVTLTPLMLYGLMVRYCNAKTVIETGVVLFIIWILTCMAAIVVLLLGIDIDPLSGLKISVDFTNYDGAVGTLRGAGPYLFLTAIAFWPVTRSTQLRVMLAMTGLFGLVAVMFSTGRTALLFCAMGGVLIALIRGRLWLAVPVLLGVSVIAGVCTFSPEILFSLPESVQRTLTPLNFSNDKTEVQSTVGASDQWHEDLRMESIPYWNYDNISFFFGHGYKSWDEGLILGLNTDPETMKVMAIEMGLTENMFSSITNVFGLTGLVLYGAFLIHLAWWLWKARRQCPPRSVERAICEISFASLASAIIMTPILGGVPGISLIFWGLGVLAARPYIGEPEVEVLQAAAVPRFDISRRIPNPKEAISRGRPAPMVNREPQYPFRSNGGRVS